MNLCPLLQKILLDNVTMQEISKHLTIKEIIRLACTCRIMHGKWINRKGLHLDNHIKAFFGWDTLKIGPFQTFRKRIYASLIVPGPCIGGCGKLTLTHFECVPKKICPYNMCTQCFGKIDSAAYMRKKGFMVADVVYTSHRLQLMAVVGTQLTADIVTDFFVDGQMWRTGKIASTFYRDCDSYNGYIRASPETIEERVTVHSATIIDDVRTYLGKLRDSAEGLVQDCELKLEDARGVLTKRRRLCEEME